MRHALGEDMTRTLVFTALVSANIALTLVNRSFEHSVLSTLRYPNHLLRGILVGTITLLMLILYVPVLRNFFHMASPNASLLSLAAGTGLLSVLWYEGVKWWKRRNEAA